MRAVDRLSFVLRSLDGHLLSNASRADLHELPALYRRVVSELAEARARGVPKERLASMEALVVRAHAILYAPVSVRFGRSLGDMLRTFPSAVRRSWRYVALAAFLMAAGGAWGYLEVKRDPSSASVLLPGGLQRNAEEGFREDTERQEGDPVYGVFYFTNNARVALNVYALGATFGVGTVLALLFNGVILGATFAVVETLGSPHAFFSFVLPHSGVELAAILVAAAGGLQIANGLLRPGWRRRKDSFIKAARESLPLVLGAAALLIVAGLVEGWISPMDMPLSAKAWVGGLLDLLLVVYLRSGRESAAAPRELTSP
jgi:uncharacterized membrane protein SpoIIM required for sporulation